MAQTLFEYADWLARRNLRWPSPPRPEPVKAIPHLKPLKGIRAVTWSLYGTLLRIAEGHLLFDPPQELRMQIALEKTIEEFHMWHSMSRKPGAPWEYLLQQYRHVLDEQRLAGTGSRGDYPEINSADVWRKLIGRLQQNEYEYDEPFYGDIHQFSEKVAYFFHANLQGVEAAPHAADTLKALAEAGFLQGLLADAQPFSLVQLLRLLRQQATLPRLDELFAGETLILSFAEGLRKPSKSLYRRCLEEFRSLGIAPEEIVHVGTRLPNDLAVAKQFGMRTVLYAAEKAGLEASRADLGDPERKPDRLITDFTQMGDLLGLG